jgi:Zn-dependent peptidase ImmA (M78 family)
VTHTEVDGLNYAAVAAELKHWGVRWSEIPNPDSMLAGFLFANARGGHVFVRRGDSLPRRRFSAAHELGHYLLHLAPALALAGADAELVHGDASIAESPEAELSTMERQANQFAAELLMPEGMCRDLCELHSRRYGPTDRFLVHHLASELLVSREAIAWRLFGLDLIAKPRWLPKGWDDDEAGADARPDGLK